MEEADGDNSELLKGSYKKNSSFKSETHRGDAESGEGASTVRVES